MALVGRLLLKRNSKYTRLFATSTCHQTGYNGSLKIEEPVPMPKMNDEIENFLSSSASSKKIVCPIRTGMKVLDKTAFDLKVSVPSLVISQNDFHLIRALKPVLLKIRKLNPTIEEEGGKKRILLNPDLVDDPKLFLQNMTDVNVNGEIIDSASLYPMTLTYDNWTHHELTNSILPDDNTKFSGFTHTGPLIQVNLNEHLLPYKHIIGDILLDKVSNAKTIVNKIQSIDTEFRNFQMEVLAGEANTVVRLKENRCEFEFDFATVYWNSRLCAEHERIVKLYLAKGDVLFDVFAGVGPFAVPAAKKNCVVFANDLNPESTKWLEKNIALNKVDKFVTVFNKDGRQFIREDIAQLLKSKLKKEEESKPAFHVTMNLPAIAVEFLDAFWNILGDDSAVLPDDFKLIVHVYCFIKGVEGFKEKALELVEEKLRYYLPKQNILDIFNVRNVAPNKEMYRVSFVMPHDVLISDFPCVPSGVKRKLSALET